MLPKHQGYPTLLALSSKPAMPKFFAAMALGVAAALCTPSVNAAPATSLYDDLSLENLAPAEAVIEAAMANLPKSIKEQQEWLKRMRLSALVPRLELYWSTSEAIYRNYNVIDRKETTRGSENSSESGSERSVESGIDNETSSSQSSENQSETTQETISNVFGQPFEFRDSTSDSTSTGTESGSAQTTSSSTRQSSSSSSRRTSFQSTTDLGPDSYVTGEDTMWVDEYGVFLTWDLAQLVFHPEEPTAARADADVATFKMELRTRVAEVYFDLVEALMLLESDSYKNSVPTKVRKMRGAFLLDQLTGGYITEYLKSGLGSAK